MNEEEQRILAAYAKRAAAEENRFFEHENLAHIIRKHERFEATLRMLKAHGYQRLGDLKILDVGCGDGNMLRRFLDWGAQPGNLAGLDLRSEPIERGSQLNRAIDLRCKSATKLLWEDETFDLVCQHTAFSSVLDASMKCQIAREMMRVLRPGGAIIWYDLRYNNPQNKDVQGISAKEIRGLFVGFDVHLQSITLAPPLARRIPEALLPVLYPFMAIIPFLRTHYLGVFKKHPDGL